MATTEYLPCSPDGKQIIDPVSGTPFALASTVWMVKMGVNGSCTRCNITHSSLPASSKKQGQRPSTHGWHQSMGGEMFDDVQHPPVQSRSYGRQSCIITDDQQLRYGKSERNTGRISSSNCLPVATYQHRILPVHPSRHRKCGKWEHKLTEPSCGMLELSAPGGSRRPAQSQTNGLDTPNLSKFGRLAGGLPKCLHGVATGMQMSVCEYDGLCQATGGIAKATAPAQTSSTRRLRTVFAGFRHLNLPAGRMRRCQDNQMEMTGDPTIAGACQPEPCRGGDCMSELIRSPPRS